jgi:hypothetical protein
VVGGVNANENMAAERRGCANDEEEENYASRGRGLLFSRDTEADF